MTILQKQELAAKKQYELIKRRNELFASLNAILKKAGFGNLEKFMEGFAEIVPPQAIVSKRVSKKTRKRRTRARITDAKLEKMKELRAKNTPRTEVADKVGVSTSAVAVWEARGFKRPAK